MRPVSSVKITLLLACLALTGCTRRYYYTDDYRLRIETTSPADNETGVSVEALILVVFSERMWPSSIDHTSFYVSRARDNAVVEGAIRVESDQRTAVFTPVQFLDPGERYEVVITDAVESRDYGYLRRDARFSFTTASTAQLGFGGGDLQFAALAALYAEAASEQARADAVRALRLGQDVVVGFLGQAREVEDPVVFAVAARLVGEAVIDALHDSAEDGEEAAASLRASLDRPEVEELRVLSDAELMRRLLPS